MQYESSLVAKVISALTQFMYQHSNNNNRLEIIVIYSSIIIIVVVEQLYSIFILVLFSGF